MYAICYKDCNCCQTTVVKEGWNLNYWLFSYIIPYLNSHTNFWHAITLLNLSMYVPFSEATKITLAPLDVEVTVGENTVLQCSASYDPSFDITFIWSVDSYIINFATDYEHYEQLVVRMKEWKILSRIIMFQAENIFLWKLLFS